MSLQNYEDDEERIDNITAELPELLTLKLKQNMILGVPVAKYDVVKKLAYLEYVDGKKEYVEN